MAIRDELIQNITARRQHVRVAPRSGTYAWIFQRASAYGLIIFLTVHMWVNHITPVTTGNELTFEIVNNRYYAYPIIYALNTIGLLTCSLFHGFNGVRNVLYDFVTNPTGRRIGTAVLVVLGIALLIDGSLTLMAIIDLPMVASTTPTP
jgi:succinate dehydrogenase/fumarate reductase cytochrome b subunit